MFLFKAKIFLMELSQFKPEILKCCQQAADEKR